MTAVQEKQLKSKAEVYKQDIQELEDNVKHWKETCLEEVSEASVNCFDAFNELQMSLTRIQDGDTKKKYQLACYKSTYNLLVFIENKVNADFFVFLYNNSKQFSNLIQHYSKYCSNTEKELSIELDSEKSIRSDESLLNKIKSYLNQ